jgi:spore photoproduct lyase
MTYSYVHDKINTDAFPNALPIFDKSMMTGRGRGKYWYRQAARDEGTRFFRDKLARFFPDHPLLYII